MNDMLKTWMKMKTVRKDLCTGKLRPLDQAAETFSHHQLPCLFPQLLTDSRTRSGLD